MKFTAAFTAAIVAAVPFFANASYIRPIARNGQCLVGNEQCCSNYGTVRSYFAFLQPNLNIRPILTLSINRSTN